MMNLSIGGLYCSITTVDGANAFVFDWSIASTATAADSPLVTWLSYWTNTTSYRQCLKILEFSALHTPRLSVSGLSGETVVMVVFSVTSLPSGSRHFNFFKVIHLIKCTRSVSLPSTIEQWTGVLRFRRRQLLCRYYFGARHIQVVWNVSALASKTGRGK